MLVVTCFRHIYVTTCVRHIDVTTQRSPPGQFGALAVCHAAANPVLILSKHLPISHRLDSIPADPSPQLGLDGAPIMSMLAAAVQHYLIFHHRWASSSFPPFFDCFCQAWLRCLNAHGWHVGDLGVQTVWDVRCSNLAGSRLGGWDGCCAQKGYAMVQTYAKSALFTSLMSVGGRLFCQQQ